MTVISGVEDLAVALCAARDLHDDHHEAQDEPCGSCWRIARALPVIDPVALADDKGLEEAVVARMHTQYGSNRVDRAREVLRALSAALSEEDA